VRLRPALAEIALAIVEMEAGDHPVAVEGNVIAEARRELRIRLHAIERAVQFAGNRAFVLQVGDVRLDPARSVEAGERGGLWEMGHRSSPCVRLYASLTNRQYAMGTMDGFTRQAIGRDQKRGRSRFPGGDPGVPHPPRP